MPATPGGLQVAPCARGWRRPFSPQGVAICAGPAATGGKRRAGSIARTDEDRRRRRRGVFAQSGAARRGRRPGARRLSQAARRRPQSQRTRRRGRRSRQDARPGRGILAGRSAARGRTADPARQGLSRSVGVRGQTARRRGGRAGRRAGSRRQALQRSRMVVEPVLRFPQAELPAHHALGQPAGHRCRRSRPAHQAEGRVLRAADRQRDVADEFRADQSGIAARNAHQQCRQPGARHAHAGRGYREPAAAI